MMSTAAPVEIIDKPSDVGGYPTLDGGTMWQRIVIWTEFQMNMKIRMG